MRNNSITSLGEKVAAVHVENRGNPELDALNSIEITETGKFSWLISITAAIGGMLFGYDTGIISAVLVYLFSDLGHELSAGGKELITSITSGGGLFNAIAAG